LEAAVSDLATIKGKNYTIGSKYVPVTLKDSPSGINVSKYKIKKRLEQLESCPWELTQKSGCCGFAAVIMAMMHIDKDTVADLIEAVFEKNKYLNMATHRETKALKDDEVNYRLEKRLKVYKDVIKWQGTRHNPITRRDEIVDNYLDYWLTAGLLIFFKDHIKVKFKSLYEDILKFSDTFSSKEFEMDPAGPRGYKIDPATSKPKIKTEKFFARPTGSAPMGHPHPVERKLSDLIANPPASLAPLSTKKGDLALNHGGIMYLMRLILPTHKVFKIECEIPNFKKLTVTYGPEQRPVKKCAIIGLGMKNEPAAPTKQNAYNVRHYVFQPDPTQVDGTVWSYGKKWNKLSDLCQLVKTWPSIWDEWEKKSKYTIYYT